MKFFEIESKAKGSTFSSRDHLEAETKTEALKEFNELYYEETGTYPLVTSCKEFDSEAAYMAQI